MAMKYVMLKLERGELVPLLFPEFMQHSHVAQSVPATVVSAGGVYTEDGKVIACGASSSLDISREKRTAGSSRRISTGERHSAEAIIVRKKNCSRTVGLSGNPQCCDVDLMKRCVR